MGTRPAPPAEDGHAGGHRGRMVGLLLLLALVTLLSVARGIGGGGVTSKSTNTYDVLLSADDLRDIENVERPYAPTSRPLPRARAEMYNATLRSARLENRGETLQSEEETQSISAATKSLPIYLLRAATNATAETTWGRLANAWNRTTQYDDLLAFAKPIPSLPPQSPKRIIVVIHCGPKTGSTTLRVACKFNLEKTCGVDRRAGDKHAPLGYMDEAKLYPLMRKCTNTTHFCGKGISMPYDVEAFEDVAFVHMFPFRQYDEWAASALKQAYDRGRETGCEKAEALMADCTPSRMEIDFRKYGKTELSKFKEGVVKRMDEKGERHVFLLYHHRELDGVLGRLSEAYDIPTLPGSSGRGKEVRPEGTCDGGVLERFHDCFSGRLMELT
ncbi:hypothetical protein ACHAXT_000127 [Thalassiosira profunda]